MTRAYARNKEHDMLEGTEPSLSRSGGHIAFARADFGLISAGGVPNCNDTARGNGLFQRYSRRLSFQFLPTHNQQ